MDVRRGYKQTEIGMVPEDWDAIPLGDLFTFKNGLNKAKRYFGYGTPIVNYMDVFGQPCLRIDRLEGLVDVSKSELEAFEVRKGDVFFTRTSETVEEIGVAAAMLDPAQDTVFSGFVLRARPTDNRLDDVFKAYCFSPRYFRQQVIARATYTTRALTNGRSLSAAILAVPPFAEQQAIAEVLSDADAAIATMTQVIAKKRDLRTGAMQRLLTGETRLPGFSAPWKQRRLGDHISFLKNGVHSRAQLTLNDPVRYLHYGDIHVAQSLCLNLREIDVPRLPTTEAIRLSRLETGDVVFVDASEDLSGVGKSLEIAGAEDIEAVAGQHTIAARFDKEVIADGFKGYLQYIPAFTTHLRRLAAGTKVYATNRKHIASAEILLPEPDEQTAIVQVLSDIDDEISALEARLEKNRALKQGMMQALLTGRVRLPSASDEFNVPEAAHA